ncbi:hypothetical protein JGU66_24725 [Myxococcaceae bacterium JPH2]|nr:hypothetical protein [Myxococcaceae bacterium JPH2]
MARRLEDARTFSLSGAPALNCPGCDTQVAEGSSICPVCDYIIDSAFLSAEPPPEQDDDESTGAAEDPRAAAKPAARARPAKPARPAPSDDATNVKSMEQITRERAQRPPSRPAPAARPSSSGSGGRAAAPAPRRAPAPPPEPSYSDVEDAWERAERRPGSSAIEDPEVLMLQGRDFLRELKGADRIAFWGAAAVVLSCFLPWKETAADGDILGLMSAGVGACLLSVGVMIAISVRVRRSLAQLNPMVPWLAQLGMSIVTLLWGLIFMKLASDTARVPTPMGNTEMMNSSPSMGVFLAVLGALAALGGTLMGLKDKSAQ